MAIIDIYSKRRKRSLQTEPDVFIYEPIPRELKNQIIGIWNDAIGIPFVNPTTRYEDVKNLYRQLVQSLRREYGKRNLSNSSIEDHSNDRSREEFVEWFLSEKDNDRVLDAIELSFRAIDRLTRETDYIGRSKSGAIADAAIDELNLRFREHSLGYEYTDGEIIRIDSKFIHDDAVKPVLTILRGEEFAGAQEEFLSAHDHFRHGKHQEALVDALKAFESTMKVIATKRGWAYDARATASDLVRLCFENGLIPPYWQTHMGGLRSVLESAIATPRNRQAGHGAGTDPAPEPPAELINYVLHMTASTILFLSEAEKNLK